MPTNKIIQWLSDPRRSYAVGLELFMAHASAVIRQRYAAYLQRKPYPTSTTDHRMQLLIDKLRRISGSMTVVSNAPAPKPAAVKAAPSNVITRKEPAADVSRLKVVQYDNLPAEQKELYARIKELVPIRTQLKAELNTANTDEARKAVAMRLVDVDDELRSLWDKMDNWSNGKSVEGDDKRPAYSDNTFVAALQVAHRRKQLADNIRCAKMSIERYTKEGRQDLLDRAQLRLERYERERDSLEKHIADAEQGH